MRRVRKDDYILSEKYGTRSVWVLVPERVAPVSTGTTRIRSGDAPTGIRPEGGNVSGFLSILVCSVIAVVSWVCHGWCHKCVINVS